MLNDLLATDALRHGAYVCLRIPDPHRRALTAAPLPALIDRLGLANEFEPGDARPAEAVALLRRVDAWPAQIADGDLLSADAVIHVASPTAAVVAQFCDETAHLLRALVTPYIVRGIVRPTNYTGGAMHSFAYAHQVIQQSGQVMPNAFLLPMRKTPDWWDKDWMERHTYFLPRYDEAGVMVNEGHALAAAGGIDCLMRRTYKSPTEPASDGGYDFLNYFECADADVPTFHAVCAALRDINRNPEWRFVREGPTWHGRRVRSWAELFE